MSKTELRTKVQWLAAIIVSLLVAAFLIEYTVSSWNLPFYHASTPPRIAVPYINEPGPKPTQQLAQNPVDHGGQGPQTPSKATPTPQDTSGQGSGEGGSASHSASSRPTRTPPVTKPTTITIPVIQLPTVTLPTLSAPGVSPIPLPTVTPPKIPIVTVPGIGLPIIGTLPPIRIG